MAVSLSRGLLGKFWGNTMAAILYLMQKSRHCQSSDDKWGLTQLIILYYIWFFLGACFYDL